MVSRSHDEAEPCPGTPCSHSFSCRHGWLPPCVPPIAKVDTGGPQAHCQPLLCLTCSRRNVRPTAAPLPGPTTQGVGVGHPSSTGLGEKRGHSTGQTSQLPLQVSRAHQDRSDTCVPALGFSGSQGPSLMRGRLALVPRVPQTP